MPSPESAPAAITPQNSAEVAPTPLALAKPLAPASTLGVEESIASPDLQPKPSTLKQIGNFVTQSVMAPFSMESTIVDSLAEMDISPSESVELAEVDPHKGESNFAGAEAIPITEKLPTLQLMKAGKLAVEA